MLEAVIASNGGATPGGRAPSSVAAPCCAAVVSSAALALGSTSPPPTADIVLIANAEISGLAVEESKVRAAKATLSGLLTEIAGLERLSKQHRDRDHTLNLELAEATKRVAELDRRLAALNLQR